jgi:hypothetical protein
MKTAVFCDFMLHIVAKFTAAEQERAAFVLRAEGICIRLHGVTLHIVCVCVPWVLLPPTMLVPQTDRPFLYTRNVFRSLCFCSMHSLIKFIECLRSFSSKCCLSVVCQTRAHTLTEEQTFENRYKRGCLGLRGGWRKCLMAIYSTRNIVRFITRSRHGIL